LRDVVYSTATPLLEADVSVDTLALAERQLIRLAGGSPR